MNFDPTWLFVSMIASSVGFGLFVYGKKQSRLPQLVAGVALMVYPYFFDSLIGLVAAGGAITAAMYYAIQAGW
jgi:hypothetical protein